MPSRERGSPIRIRAPSQASSRAARPFSPEDSSRHVRRPLRPEILAQDGGPLLRHSRPLRPLPRDPPRRVRHGQRDPLSRSSSPKPGFSKDRPEATSTPDPYRKYLPGRKIRSESRRRSASTASATASPPTSSKTAPTYGTSRSSSATPAQRRPRSTPASPRRTSSASAAPTTAKRNPRLASGETRAHQVPYRPGNTTFDAASEKDSWTKAVFRTMAAF